MRIHNPTKNHRSYFVTVFRGKSLQLSNLFPSSPHRRHNAIYISCRTISTFPRIPIQVPTVWSPQQQNVQERPTSSFTKRSSYLIIIRRLQSTQTSQTNNSNNINATQLYGSASLPKHGQLELDFFGEPVTFLGLTAIDMDNTKTTTATNSGNENENSNTSSSSSSSVTTNIISNAMAALDNFLLAIVSKGRTCVGGGDEGGLEMRGPHAVALAWSEVLRYATIWNPTPTTTTTGTTCDDVGIEDDKQEQQQKENTSTDPEKSDTDATHSSQSRDTTKKDSTIGSGKSAPMLAVVAVAPLLAQTGLAYVQHLDTLLLHAKPGVPGLPTISFMGVANVAIQSKNDAQHFNIRERLHLQALDYLLQNQFPTALTIYLQILTTCPGDALALSQAIDLAYTLGDKQAALRASGSVASYWNERRGGLIQPSLPGNTLASSLMAVGFAVAGRDEYAEIMAERCLTDGHKVCGAIATWAQCHIFDVRGRVSEGISALANFDGISNYEGAGFLFFESRLQGYGARFSLDREQRGRGKSTALRLYANTFERILLYSGFSQGRPWYRPMQRAPLGWREPNSIASGIEVEESVWSKLFGGTKSRKRNVKNIPNYEMMVKQVNTPSTDVNAFEPVIEDVLTWLPPTPALLTDSTLLLLRFVLNGTISVKNPMWDDTRNSWKAMLEIQEKHQESSDALIFYPLASVTASLLFPPLRTGGDQIGNGRLAEGLYTMGELLKLGGPIVKDVKTTAIREIVADTDPNFWLPVRDDEQQKEWRKVVEHFAAARDGIEYVTYIDDNDEEETIAVANTALRFQSWDFDARPILEHALVYAACKAGDTESLCLARSICSQGVTLRQIAPEEWWRYSIVLGLLGDETGSETALEHSINFGGGQGARA